MRLMCKECGAVFSSLILDPEEAMKDVSDQLGKHAQNQHKAMMVRIARQVSELAPLLISQAIFHAFASEGEGTEKLFSSMEETRKMLRESLKLEGTV